MDLCCLSPITIRNPAYGDTSDLQFIQVSCGKCPACIMRRKNEWVNRLKMESRLYVSNKFFTLTYDEINEPYKESEEYGFVPVHRYSDFQAFKKRLNSFLRYRGFSPPRFVVCSEYGPQTFRSHYHGIFFDWPTGVDIQTTVLKCWQKGIECPCYELTDGGSSYVCKYMFKQQQYLDGQPKNFKRQSINPPIGFGALTERQFDYYATHETDLYRFADGSSFTLPRSFKSKIFLDSSLRRISQAKQDAYGRQMEDTLKRLSSRLGSEHEAFKYLAELRRQQWIYLNRTIYRSYHKQNKLL